MKQSFLGLAVIATALAAAAFTTPKASNLPAAYYFRVDASGNTINASVPPPTSNYSECTDAGGVNCSRSYPGFSNPSPGVYSPVGAGSAIIKKP